MNARTMAPASEAWVRATRDHDAQAVRAGDKLVVHADGSAVLVRTLSADRAAALLHAVSGSTPRPAAAPESYPFLARLGAPRGGAA
jgi:hypothetical protein